MWSLREINRLNGNEYCPHGEWQIECPECKESKLQCPALSLIHIMSNACVRPHGHKGNHQNALGTFFSKCVMKATDLPLEYGRRCADHPRYQLKRPPRSTCEMCWRLWVKFNS